MPTLVVREEDRTWLVDLPDAAEWTLGRAHACDLPLETPRASRRHARLRVAGGRCVIEDLGSTNGTLLNGAPLEGPRELAEGDEIGIGDCRLVFRGRP